MTSFKRQQQKYVKQAYRVRNWAEYEAGLRSRGSLTVWLEVDAVGGTVPGWNAPVPRRRKRGRQMKYSKLAVETSLRIGAVYHLRLRQTEGFLRSLFSLLKLDADVPDHTTVSKRSAKLGRVQLGNSQSKKPVHIIIGSTGRRVHVGQLRKPPKNRDYRKLHFGIDERTGGYVQRSAGTGRSASSWIGTISPRSARHSSALCSTTGTCAASICPS